MLIIMLITAMLVTVFAERSGMNLLLYCVLLVLVPALAGLVFDKLLNKLANIQYIKDNLPL